MTRLHMSFFIMLRLIFRFFLDLCCSRRRFVRASESVARCFGMLRREFVATATLRMKGAA